MKWIWKLWVMNNLKTTNLVCPQTVFAHKLHFRQAETTCNLSILPWALPPAPEQGVGGLWEKPWKRRWQGRGRQCRGGPPRPAAGPHAALDPVPGPSSAAAVATHVTTWPAAGSPRWGTEARPRQCKLLGDETLGPLHSNCKHALLTINVSQSSARWPTGQVEQGH